VRLVLIKSVFMNHGASSEYFPKNPDKNQRNENIFHAALFRLQI
jgi:hypothetical protein